MIRTNKYLLGKQFFARGKLSIYLSRNEKLCYVFSNLFREKSILTRKIMIRTQIEFLILRTSY
jgi:hypothetical protein